MKNNQQVSAIGADFNWALIAERTVTQKKSLFLFLGGGVRLKIMSLNHKFSSEQRNDTKVWCVFFFTKYE